MPNEVFVGQKDINELQRRVKYETNVKDTIHLGQVLKAEKLYVGKKETCFFVDVEFSLPRVHADMSMVSVVSFLTSIILDAKDEKIIRKTKIFLIAVLNIGLR